MDDTASTFFLMFVFVIFGCSMCSVNMNHSRNSLQASLDYGDKVCASHGGLEDVDVWPWLTGKIEAVCKDGSSIKGKSLEEKQ